jgi:hypothetical protein
MRLHPIFILFACLLPITHSDWEFVVLPLGCRLHVVNSPVFLFDDSIRAFPELILILLESLELFRDNVLGLNSLVS